MAVRAHEGEVFESRSIAGAQGGERLRVVALDEARSSLSVGRREVEAARLTLKLAVVGEGALLLGPEAQLAVSALDALPSPGAVAGGHALVAICDRHSLEDAVGVLNTWLDRRE